MYSLVLLLACQAPALEESVDLHFIAIVHSNGTPLVPPPQGFLLQCHMYSALVFAGPAIHCTCALRRQARDSPQPRTIVYSLRFIPSVVYGTVLYSLL